MSVKWKYEVLAFNPFNNDFVAVSFDYNWADYRHVLIIYLFIYLRVFFPIFPWIVITSMLHHQAELFQNYFEIFARVEFSLLIAIP